MGWEPGESVVLVREQNAKMEGRSWPSLVPTSTECLPSVVVVTRCVVPSHLSPSDTGVGVGVGSGPLSHFHLCFNLNNTASVKQHHQNHPHRLLIFILIFCDKSLFPASEPRLDLVFIASCLFSPRQSRHTYNPSIRPLGHYHIK